MYNFIPEGVLIFSALVICLINILRPQPTLRSTLLIKLTLIIGIVVSAIIQLLLPYNILAIAIFFKLYFAIASLFFILTYSKRFSAAECLSVLGLTTGSFLICSSNTSIVMFCSMSLFIASLFYFTVTRERIVSKEGVFVTTLVLMLILVYKASPLVSLTTLIVITMIILMKTKNKDIEAVIMSLVMPLVFYLLIVGLSTSERDTICMSLRLIGIATLILSSVLMFTSKYEGAKRSTKYGLFYLGSILLFISFGTKESVSLSLILVFLIPFTYSQNITSLSIINFAAMPISPSFIARYVFLTLLLRAEAWLEASVLLISSLVFWIFGAYDLADHKQPNTKPKALTYLSILVLIISAIFFNSFHNMLKTSLIDLLRMG